MYKEDYNMPLRTARSAVCATMLLLAVSCLGVVANHGSTPTSAPSGVLHNDSPGLNLAVADSQLVDPLLRLAAVPWVPWPTPDSSATLKLDVPDSQRADPLLRLAA